MISQPSMFQVVAVLTSVVFGMRVLPFVVGAKLGNNVWIQRLGRQMPACVIFLLTLHTVESSVVQHGQVQMPLLAAQLLGMAVVCAAHLLWRNMSVSIFSGTAVYVALQYMM